MANILLFHSIASAYTLPIDTAQPAHHQRKHKKRKIEIETIYLTIDSSAKKDTIIIAKIDSHSVPTLKIAVDSSILYTDTVVTWLDVDSGMRLLQQTTNKKAIIYIYAGWCKWCKITRDSVFANREIAHYLNGHYIPIKFDAETTHSVWFQGREFHYRSRIEENVHELSLMLLNNRQSYPGFIIMDEGGHIIKSQTGYMDASLFESYLHYYSTNAYKSIDFDHWDEDFDGKIKW